MKGQKDNTGFTLVEMITVITIIAILLGILIPAVTAVRNFAKVTQQRAQISAIDLGLTGFKNDHGGYPPSSERDAEGDVYCGAQKLAEAMVGQDLLGFHPDSEFLSDGRNSNDTNDFYPDDLDLSTNEGKRNLDERSKLYLNEKMTNAFKLSDLFKDTKNISDAATTYVLCDVFGVKRLTLTSGGQSTVYKAGTPILYYRADASKKPFHDVPVQQRVYNCYDNRPLIDLGILRRLAEDSTLSAADVPHKLAGGTQPYFYFYSEEYKIYDPKASTPTMARPHRPDSYILISAGPDGEYGTVDDITNFE